MSRIWEMKNGKNVSVDDMTSTHIVNCMKMLGVEDERFWMFAEVMGERAADRKRRASVLEESEGALRQKLLRTWFEAALMDDEW